LEKRLQPVVQKFLQPVSCCLVNVIPGRKRLARGGQTDSIKCYRVGAGKWVVCVLVFVDSRSHIAEKRLCGYSSFLSPPPQPYESQYPPGMRHQGTYYDSYIRYKRSTRRLHLALFRWTMFILIKLVLIFVLDSDKKS
nr:hypothetical protein [Tanacetum cinerariifolium]